MFFQVDDVFHRSAHFCKSKVEEKMDIKFKYEVKIRKFMQHTHESEKKCWPVGQYLFYFNL